VLYGKGAENFLKRDEKKGGARDTLKEVKGRLRDLEERSLGMGGLKPTRDNHHKLPLRGERGKKNWEGWAGVGERHAQARNCKGLFGNTVGAVKKSEERH